MNFPSACYDPELFKTMTDPEKEDAQRRRDRP